MVYRNQSAIDLPWSSRGVLRDSAADSAAVLLQWWVRSAVPALFFAALTVAWLLGPLNAESLDRIDDPTAIVSNLSSPLVGVLLVLALRIAVVSWPSRRRGP